MAGRDFLEAPRERVETSAGEVELPVAYRDASAVFAFFRVDLLRAVEAIGDAPLTVARFGGSVALAGVAAYDYRDTSIGPYREVAVALAVLPRGVDPPALPLLHLVRPRAAEVVGWHVLDLPVTTALADAAGRELWGLPKFVTQIDVEVVGPDVSAVVQAPDGEEPIASLCGRQGRGLALGATELVLYSVRQGALLRTSVEGRGSLHTGSGHGLALRVGGAGHPMARRLAALGLDGARPLAVQVCPRYRALLHGGVPFHAPAARAA